MFIRIAAAAKRIASPELRRISLPVCTGALILAFSAGALTLIDLRWTLLLAAVGLIGLGATLLGAIRQAKTIEGALQSEREAAKDLDHENAELRRFAMLVAHDLRAPLVTTTGLLSMAKENAETGEVEDLLMLLERAEKAALRMDGLISGFLDLATKTDAPLSETVDLDGAVDNTLEDLAPALQLAGFDIRRDERLGEVIGDPRYVQQVFDNVLGNALKYGRPADPSVRPQLEIRAERRGGLLRISIGDNGPGVEPDRVGTLLAAASADSARPTKVTGEGRPVTGGNIGLGLSLVRQAMDACHGTLSLRSSTLGGAEFVLDFQATACPITTSAPLPAPQLAPRAAAPRRSPARLPVGLQQELISAHACSSLRMMLTTG